MRELAEKLGVSHPHISKLESGENLPSITLLHGMADLFGIHIRDFFNIEDAGELEDGIRIGYDKTMTDGVTEEAKQKAVEFVRDFKAGKIDIDKLKDIDV